LLLGFSLRVKFSGRLSVGGIRGFPLFFPALRRSNELPTANILVLPLRHVPMFISWRNPNNNMMDN